MDLSVTSEEYQVEDRSWLGSRDGTEVTDTITLDTSAFTATTHYPNGYVPSGTVVARLDSGLYGPYGGNASEGQTVTITGTPTGGTFTLTLAGQTTAAIAYNATAAAVQTALEALSNVNVGDVTVTGGPGPGTPYVVAFGGQYAGEDMPQMTASGASLTGGTSPAVGVTTTTAGGGTGGTAAGFLFSSIHVSRLPANSGLDAAARQDLAAKFRFK
jgi:hypothetical protein